MALLKMYTLELQKRVKNSTNREFTEKSFICSRIFFEGGGGLNVKICDSISVKPLETFVLSAI